MMRLAQLASVGCLALACRSELDSREGLVTSPRVIAVRAEPAEVRPGRAINYLALIAMPLESDRALEPAWSYCNATKPLSENNAVSAQCLGTSFMVPLGNGLAIDTSMPTTACGTFGPDTARGGHRPHDPDATGGYYQPLRVVLGDSAPSFYLSRILCNLASAPSEQAVQFAQAYLPNSNPRVEALETRAAGHVVALDQIPADADIQLALSWPAQDSESYAYYELQSQTVVTRREAMDATWYATSGTFASFSTGRSEDDPVTQSDNTWHSPAELGPVHLWVVLRDSRGGIGFGDYRLTVVP